MASDGPLPLPDPMPRDRLVALRAWVAADAAFLARVASDDHLRRFVSGLPSPYTQAVAEAWIAGQAEARAARSRIDLAAADRVSGRLVGAVGLSSIDDAHRRAELGYWSAPSERGRGVASHAARLLARWAFNELRLERLQLLVEPVNMGSVRVAEAIGARQEGLLREHSIVAGQRRDVLVYGLLPDELQ